MDVIHKSCKILLSFFGSYAEYSEEIVNFTYCPPLVAEKYSK